MVSSTHMIVPNSICSFLTAVLPRTLPVPYRMPMRLFRVGHDPCLVRVAK